MCYSVKMFVKIFIPRRQPFNSCLCTLYILVLFFVNWVMLQSLEDVVVNEIVLSLAGLQSWHSLSYGRFQVGDPFTQIC